MLKVLTGRYGPYIKQGKVNASVPKDKDPEKLTYEEAKALIDELSRKSATHQNEQN